MNNLKFCLIFFAVQVQLLSAQSFFTLTNNKEKASLHFDLFRNIIVIPVYLNGSGPFNFILDTGAGHCIITDPELIQKLNLQKGRDIIISGSGEQKGVRAFLSNDITTSNKHIKSIPLAFSVFEDDPFFLSSYLGIRIQGILGFEFFNSFTIKINYSAKTITLYESLIPKSIKRYTAIPIRLKNKKPYLTASCILNKESIPLDLLIDTGTGFPLSLETYSNSKIIIPEKKFVSELGIGLNGIIHGNLARIPILRISSYNFPDVVTAFPDYKDSGAKQISDHRNGSIGNFLLNHFTIIIDYAGGNLYVKPNENFNEQFPYDRVGVEIIAKGENFTKYFIQWVKPGSPAEETGILPGDEIEEINFRKVTEFSLDHIDHMLSDPDFQSIVFRLKRDNEILYVIVEMRDLI